MTTKPLLLRACEEKAFGSIMQKGNSRVLRALFTFLDGDADVQMLNDIPTGAHLVPMSESWAEMLGGMQLESYTRRHMKPQKAYHTEGLEPLAEGYAIKAFDAEAFAQKPFDHGTFYRDAQDFAQRGVGAVAVYQGRIVASASSVISHGAEVELDISTEEVHRRRGLALHCAAEMIRECVSRGLTVHWDAQNEASYNLARKLGYETECEYTVYMWKNPIEEYKEETKMIKVGLVGVGAMGSGHLANYMRLMKEGADVKLVAVCDIRPEQLERKDNTDLNIEIKQETFEAEYNKYTDFKEMMAKEEMDYIDFAVPTYLHAEMAIAAMENGFNVLSEKPMALNVAECERMIETSMRTGKLLMVAQCLRFWPAYEQLKKLVVSGEWGKVVSAMFFRGGATPIWSYQDWLRKKEKSGGCLLDQHIHDVDMINWLFGTPEYVSTAAINTIPGSGYDAVSTNYYYADGKVINAQDDWTINGDGFGFEMIFRVNFEKGAAILTRDGFKLMPVGGEAYTPDMPEDDGYYREMCYFMDCLKNGKKPETCLPTSTMETIRIAWAEVESAEKGGERIKL